MAGEINGTTVLITKNAVGVVGQMEATITYGGTPIDISNKSFGDWITSLDDNLSGKQVIIAGTIVYNNDIAYEAIKNEAFTGKQDTYGVDFLTGEKLDGTFVPTGMSDSIPHGDKVSTAISFNSSGEVVRTPQTAPAP
ncbi:MAG: hypothetical protein BA864_05215 [Desulfuromonadales bacterium C00003093]|jgi:predicted secreted protein|nr:MAG: hypothetical protein BA864_05215 [Desulfuromonadales bacterium C00003093]